MTESQLIDRARRLEASGMSVRKMAITLGKSEDWVKRRLDPTYAKRRNAQVKACRARGAYVQPPSCDGVTPRKVRADAEARKAEIPPDMRDLTARVFGDPIYERSALYRQEVG